MLGGLRKSQPPLLMYLAAAMPEVVVETVGSLGAEAGVANAALESRAEKPMVPEGQTVCPEASKGMVGHAVRPPSPLVVPPAAIEEDEVEEIKHEESQPQAVRIVCKRGNEVVVVEEEDTTRELRRLESALARVMKQIKVSTVSRLLVFDVGGQSSS